MDRRGLKLPLAALALLACTPACTLTPGTDEGGDEADTSESGSDTQADTSESGSDTQANTDDSDGSTDATGSDTGGLCPTPLPPEAFDIDKQLAFGLWLHQPELVAGSSREFQVGLVECCYVWEPLETCSVYSVEPDDVGASIDPDSGLLTLADDVPDGTVITVRADIEDGLATVEESFFVYHPELHPLKGFWTEVARIPCGGGPEYVPDDPIGEVFFTAAGTLGVTWTPFEVYVDYTADYSAGLDAGTLSLANLGGNYVPDDVDPEGSFAFEGDELVLTDMWLGSSQGAMDPPACGHRLGE